MAVQTVPLMLVLYHRPVAFGYRDASTVMEHVLAFERYSAFTTWKVNTAVGLPAGLADVDPAVTVLHYSLFGSGEYRLDNEFLAWLKRTRAYKVAFFQDEYAWMRKRFAFVDEFEIDSVYTHVAERDFGETWTRYTQVPQVAYNLPGYVSDEMIAAAHRYARRETERDIDVGYRGRPLPAFFGRGAQEKTVIAEEFLRHAEGSGLRLDVRTGEGDRIYGDAWYEFLGRCHCMLGVESGVSYLDLEDEVLADRERLRAELGREPTLAELEKGPLGKWDGNFAYRTIGPRHFEAAAFRICQILFPGDYSGAMEPMVHYVPLEKDFSNIDTVLELIADRDARREIADNAHRDLIESGNFTYETFIGRLDQHLRDQGLQPEATRYHHAQVRAATRRAHRRRRLRQFGLGLRLWIAEAVYRYVAPITRPIRRALGISKDDL